MDKALDQETLTQLAGEVLHRAPAWVRADLSSSDATLRTRAEDVLAAMIGAALYGGSRPGMVLPNGKASLGPVT